MAGGGVGNFFEGESVGAGGGKECVGEGAPHAAALGIHVSEGGIEQKGLEGGVAGDEDAEHGNGDFADGTPFLPDGIVVFFSDGKLCGLLCEGHI